MTSAKPPTKSTRTDPSSRRARETHVKPGKAGWKVTIAARGHAIYGSQAEAVAAAQAHAREKGARIVIHGSDGTVSTKLTLGRLAFEKVSAVEGIRLTARMRRDMRDLDGHALSGEDRRRVMALKYGKLPKA